MEEQQLHPITKIDKEGKKKLKEGEDIESFRNGTKLREIEIKENQRKRKGDTMSPREEERMIKVRVTRRKKEKGEKNKEEESKENLFLFPINILFPPPLQVPYPRLGSTMTVV